MSPASRFTERNAANCIWALGMLQRHGVQVRQGGEDGDV